MNPIGVRDSGALARSRREVGHARVDASEKCTDLRESRDNLLEAREALIGEEQGALFFVFGF
jgi:hypothetical protein